MLNRQNRPFWPLFGKIGFDEGGAKRPYSFLDISRKRFDFSEKASSKNLRYFFRKRLDLFKTALQNLFPIFLPISAWLPLYPCSEELFVFLRFSTWQTAFPCSERIIDNSSLSDLTFLLCLIPSRNRIILIFIELKSIKDAISSINNWLLTLSMLN